jgi:hypothetical protein
MRNHDGVGTVSVNLVNVLADFTAGVRAEEQNVQRLVLGFLGAIGRLREHCFWRELLGLVEAVIERQTVPSDCSPTYKQDRNKRPQYDKRPTLLVLLALMSAWT